MQRGNLTVITQIRKEEEEKIASANREQLARAPTWLIDAAAKKEYRRIIKEFKEIQLIGNLDLNNIAAYCNAYSFYLRATKDLKEQPLVVKKILPNGSATVVENPLIKIQKTYADEMRRFAGLCGLTIDSRLKIAAVKEGERESSIRKEFGEI